MFRKKYRETYNFFSTIKKELENDKTITCKLKFIESSISTLVDSLSEGLHNKKCRKYKFCLQYISVEDNKLICECIDCNKDYKLHLNKDLINS